MSTPEAIRNLERRYREGITLFKEGEDSRELYIMMSGSVGVYKQDREIAVINQAGSYFGEMSTLLGQPRTATVKTIEHSRMLVIPPDRAPDFFGHSPQLALKIARGLATRLASTTQDLSEQAEQLKRSVFDLNKLYKEVASHVQHAAASKEARKNLDLRLTNVLKQLGTSKFLEKTNIVT